MTRSSTRRWFAGAVALITLSAGVAACGDDDSNEAASTATSAVASGDLQTYCEKSVEIETLPEPDFDFAKATPEEAAAVSKAYAKDKIRPRALEIQDAAPAEVRDEVDFLVSMVNKLAETGDFASTFGTPEFDAAGKRAHGFDLKNCGWAQIDVTAKEYAFQGISSDIHAGVTSFELTNAGTEAHELVIIRKNDDTTETFDQLLALPEEQAKAKTTMIASGSAAPGESDYVLTDLKAGDYLAVCFIPKGTTSQEHQGDGPPHFTQGMKTEFTVS